MTRHLRDFVLVVLALYGLSLVVVLAGLGAR